MKSPNPCLETYKSLQRSFKRRLRATYSKLSELPDNSVICGQNYVYFLECDAIYRKDRRQNEAGAEQVLYLGQCSTSTEKREGEQEEEEEWAIQRVRLSPCEKHLAATVKSSHREEAICMVVKLVDVASPSQDASHTVFTLDNVYSFEWASDEVLFYTTQEGLRCSRVFCLDLTSSVTRNSPVFEDAQPNVFVEVALSRDQLILTINSNSKTDSEVWLIDVTTPNLEPFMVQPRIPELMYHVEHWKGWAVILANTGPGQEYQVLKAPLAMSSMKSWVPLHTPCPGVAVKDMVVVGDHCVLTTRESTGKMALTAVPLACPKEAYSIKLPSWACAFEPKRPDLGDSHGVLRFLLSSPVHPQVPFSFYPNDRLILSGTEMEGTSQEKDTGDKCITKRLEAQSQDGSWVPVTVFYSVAVGCLKEAPLLVHVYGAYGRDLSMEFSPERRLLLEQGWVLAYCHVRGGGERGLSWHRHGRVEQKQRGVEDLRACLQHLHSRGISSPSLSAITARSAGAVPAGALCNTDPHLMRAVTLQAPFLDVLGTMEDDSLPLTVEEREEWGDPTADPQHRRAIASYCPLHNIIPQCYPSVLLTAYSRDARVPLAGVIKYTEKLKEAIHTHFTTNHVPEHRRVPNVVLNVQPGTDHFGPTNFDLMLEESALQLAFLYAELGLDPPKPPSRRRR